MKVIFGWGVNYETLIESGKVQSLREKREESALKFALKAVQSPRFGNDWFKETPTGPREVRPNTRNKYIEMQCRTERGKNNPIQYLTRRLNEHYKEI